MALTPEQLHATYMRSGLGKFHLPADALQCEYDRCIYDFARAIEAEVHRDDEALIRQMLEALEQSQPFTEACANGKRMQWWGAQLDRAQDAINEARARLEEKP